MLLSRLSWIFRSPKINDFYRLSTIFKTIITQPIFMFAGFLESPDVSLQEVLFFVVEIHVNILASAFWSPKMTKIREFYGFSTI